MAAKVQLLNNSGTPVWEYEFTPRDLKVLKHSMEDPIAEFTTFLEAVINAKITQEKAALVRYAIQSLSSEDDVVMDKLLADPSYEDAAARAAGGSEVPDEIV